jgi:hypothetical protein
MIASTQKALIVTEIGKPLQLVDDHAVVQPEVDQVLIKVRLIQSFVTDLSLTYYSR